MVTALLEGVEIVSLYTTGAYNVETVLQVNVFPATEKVTSSFGLLELVPLSLE